MLLAALLLALSQAAPPPTDAVRAIIEPEFRKKTGFGYRSFTCADAPPPATAGFIDCDAVDEEGDALHYTLTVDAEGGAKLAMTSLPGTTLNAENRALLDPPCRAFLEAYVKKDWGAAYAALHPALQEKLSLDGMKAQLEPVRAALGAHRSAELRLHALRFPDLRELEYALSGGSGPGVARFRLGSAPAGVRIVAFSVAPEAGSAAQTELLEPPLRGGLASVLGVPVQRLLAPLDRLRRPGDTAPGTALLAGGREVAIEARQKGRRDDFDVEDYTVEVTDVPYLVERHLRGTGVEVAAVTCPERVLADGATQTCRARTAKGERAVTVARWEGQFRITGDTASSP